MRRVIERSLDPRARALFHALREWLPRVVAWDRAMNAAAPIFLLEGAGNGHGLEAPDVRGAIEASLGNAAAMSGVVASKEQIDAALAAWCEAAGASHPGPITGHES
jgi:hypothetical protein